MSQSLCVCTQLNGFKYCYLIEIIWFNFNEQFYFTLTGTSTQGQSEPQSNSNDLVSYLGQSLKGAGLLFCRDAVSTHSKAPVDWGGYTIVKSSVCYIIYSYVQEELLDAYFFLIGYGKHSANI